VYAEAFKNRGWAWFHKKEYDKALADYAEAIRLNPEFAQAFLDRGLIWSAKKEWGKALADYDEAIRIDPKFAWAHNNRAWVMATCPDAKYRDGRRAVAAARRACELSVWEQPKHLETLAAAFAEAGDFTEAVKWQKNALEIFQGEDAETARRLLKLYEEGKPYRQN
jgi:tetratricopeptide (TPR) repeat protein